MPDRYVSWEEGEKHAPMAIRKQKKKQEEMNQKQKEYQKLYREKKKNEKKTMPIDRGCHRCRNVVCFVNVCVRWVPFAN